jgi:hypothetical protein
MAMELSGYGMYSLIKYEPEQTVYTYKLHMKIVMLLRKS